jgi:hypothetical protein
VYPVTGLPQILCIVAATQAGDKIWAAAEPVMRTFLWTKAAMKLTVTGTNTVNSNGAKIQVAATTVNLELMSGLRSLGVPVSVVSNTPATCAVSNVQISDIGGSLYTTFMISAISNGICSTTSSFAGSDVRLPTSTTWATTIKK